nr:unnamed protein product [Digitaria exilis]
MLSGGGRRRGRAASAPGTGRPGVVAARWPAARCRTSGGRRWWWGIWWMPAAASGGEPRGGREGTGGGGRPGGGGELCFESVWLCFESDSSFSFGLQTGGQAQACI